MALATAALALPSAARAQCPLNSTDPSVTICTPADGATVTSPVHIVAGTTDSHTVVAMKIYVDGVSSFLQNNTSSIDTSLAMSAGTHRITVKAWDNFSQVFSQTINVTVSSGGGGSFTVSPSSLTFGSQNVGTTSAPQAVTLSNTTASAVSISSIQATGDFAQTNNCGTSLAANTTCTVNVTFTPTATGTRSGTLTITDSDPSSPQSVALTGTGASSGTCTLSAVDPSVTICTPANGATVPSPVHIVAGTTDSRTVIAMKIYVDGVVQFSGTSNSIDTSLAMAAGAHRITVKAWDNASPQQVFWQTINITVGSGGGSFTVSPSSLSFSNQTVGTSSAPQAVTLNNTTATAISISSIAASGDFAETNNCGTSLAANASCTVNVTFTPTTTGTRTGTLTITDSDPSSPQTVSLTGTGASGGSVTASPASLTFSNQIVGTTSAPQTVTLSNTTASAVSISSIQATGDFAQTNNCGTSLVSNASCTVNVTFTPTTTGTRTGTLTITDSDPSNPQSVALTGTGGTSSNCQLSSTDPSVTICQPANGATVPSPVHIVAGTTDSHTVIAMKIYVDGVAQFSGTSNAIDTFLPMAIGAHRITVRAWDNASPQQVFWQTINITVGSGGGSVTVSPSSLTFSSQAVNTTSAAQTVMLSNDTSSALAINTISASGDFAETNDCGTSVAASGSCTISVTFTPTATGTRTGTLTISDSDATSPQTVSLTGSGGTGGGGSGLNVLTYHYDNARTGVNPNESSLTPQNVNTATFGKLFTYAVDGYVHAQPLYVSGLSIAGGTHNVIFIATEGDSVYAFDADTNIQLWHTGFTNGSTITTVLSTDVSDSNEGPQVGITCTPVIDLGSNTIYVIAATKENGSYFQRLHALDLSSGAEKFGGPTQIQASFPGTGSPNDGAGNVLFDPKLELQRTGLLLMNGVIYAAWASHNDTSPWHGWVMAFDAGTLGLISAWNDTPDGNAGGIWMAGGGLVGDSAGNIYLMNGNGNNNLATGGRNYGQSFVKLALNGGALTVVDSFTPFNWSTLNATDVDLGSGGPVLVPGSVHPQLLIGGGKEGKLYVVNAGALGGLHSSDNVVQEIPAAYASEIFGPPVFFNGHIYLASASDVLKSWTLDGSDQLSLSSSASTVWGGRSVIPTISANGTSNGIVWTVAAGGPMHVYDASNLATELYNTTQNTADSISGNKFASATVVNGKVYVPLHNAVAVFGLK